MQSACYDDFLMLFVGQVSTAQMREMDDAHIQDLLDAVYARIVTDQPSDKRQWWTWAKAIITPFVHESAGSDDDGHTTLNTKVLYNAHVGFKRAVKGLKSVLQKRGLADYLDERAKSTLVKFDRILQVGHHVNSAFTHMTEVSQIVAPAETLERKICDLPCVWRGSHDPNAFQILIFHVLECLRRAGMRRIDDSCYVEVQYQGWRTCYWKRECSIAEFIHTCIDKETSFREWCELTGKRNQVDQIEQYLTMCNDLEFKELRPARGTFAFTNGVYETTRNVFRCQTEIDQARDVHDEEIVAVQFFQYPFDPDDATCPDWRRIDTPEFDSIFEYQGYDAPSIDWAAAMLGRILYNVSERDNWQVGIFFKGVAGSGKSTLANLMKTVYPANMVGTLSSNGEDKFGLSAIHDKLIYVCSEVKEGFTLNQGDWQSMITGEEVSVAIKNKLPITKRWVVPGILCGNELPRWVDAAGSVVRRLVLFEFPNKVRNSDPDLFEKLKRSLPALLCKMNRAYHEMTWRHGWADIWKPGVLPSKILEFRDKLRRDVDALAAFLDDIEYVQLDPTSWVPESDFINTYSMYRDTNQLPKAKWCKDHYGSVFSDKEIKVEASGGRVHPDTGHVVPGKVIVGLRLGPPPHRTPSEQNADGDGNVTIDSVGDIGMV